MFVFHEHGELDAYSSACTADCTTVQELVVKYDNVTWLTFEELNV
jgi:hypothetical protein